MVITVPGDLAGVLEGAVASWYRGRKSARIPYPVHVWLTIVGLGTRELHVVRGKSPLATVDRPIAGMADLPAVRS